MIIEYGIYIEYIRYQLIRIIIIKKYKYFNFLFLLVYIQFGYNNVHDPDIILITLYPIAYTYVNTKSSVKSLKSSIYDI